MGWSRSRSPLRDVPWRHGQAVERPLARRQLATATRRGPRTIRGSVGLAPAAVDPEETAEVVDSSVASADLEGQTQEVNVPEDMLQWVWSLDGSQCLLLCHYKNCMEELFRGAKSASQDLLQFSSKVSDYYCSLPGGSAAWPETLSMIGTQCAQLRSDGCGEEIAAAGFHFQKEKPEPVAHSRSGDRRCKDLDQGAIGMPQRRPEVIEVARALYAEAAAVNGHQAVCLQDTVAADMVSDSMPYDMGSDSLHDNSVLEELRELRLELDAEREAKEEVKQQHRQMREKLVFMRGEEHNEVTCVDSLRSELWERNGELHDYEERLGEEAEAQSATWHELEACREDLAAERNNRSRVKTEHAASKAKLKLSNQKVSSLEHSVQQKDDDITYLRNRIGEIESEQERKQHTETQELSNMYEHYAYWEGEAE